MSYIKGVRICRRKKTNSKWLESHLFSVCSVHIIIEKGSPFLKFLSLWWPRRRCRWCGGEWVLLALLDWYFCSPSLAKGGGTQLLHSCIYICIHKISMMWRFIINVTAPWVASFNTLRNNFIRKSGWKSQTIKKKSKKQARLEFKQA